MREVINCINRSSKVLVLSHKNPDGDALGSSLAMYMALEHLGKSVEIFSVSEVSKVFDFLPNIKSIKNKTSANHYDLVILLDCANFKRVGLESDSLGFSFDCLLVIDHHPHTDTEKNVNLISWIDHRKSSACVMVYEVLSNLDINIDKKIATCLLTGIFTDTGGFQHNNTDEESLIVAAELMKKGPRIDKISHNIFSNKNLPAIKLWGKALSRIKTDPITGMAISYVSMEDIEGAGAKKEDLDGLISVINTVSDAEFSLLLTETEDNKIKGSLRSEEYKGIDVSRIARSLGGGGHKLASGFEVEGDMEDSLKKISELVTSLKSVHQQDK